MAAPAWNRAMAMHYAVPGQMEILAAREQDARVAEYHRKTGVAEMKKNNPLGFLQSWNNSNTPWISGKGALLMQRNNNNGQALYPIAEFEFSNLILLNTHFSPKLSELNIQAAAALQSYSEGYYDIVHNAGLSQIGKDSAINKLRIEWDKSIAGIEKEVADFAAGIAASETQIDNQLKNLAVQSFTEPLAQAKAADIRNHVATLKTNGDKRSFFSDNVLPEVLFALNTCAIPTLRAAVIPDDELEQYRSFVIEKTLPEQFTELTTAKFVLKEIQTNLESLSRARAPRERAAMVPGRVPGTPGLTEQCIAANKADKERAAGN